MKHWSKTLGLAAAAAGMLGCSALRMVPPPDVARESDVFEATHRSRASGLFADEAFTIGPFQVGEVQRDANVASGLSVLAYAKDDVRTAYAYELAEGADIVPGQCASLRSRKSFSLGALGELGSEDANLGCTCGTGASAATLELGGKPERPAGLAKVAGRTLDVASVHDTTAAWSPRDAAGFRIDGAEGPVAAVEVLHPGRMWLSRTLAADERRQVACLLAGLMLYVEPTDE